MDEHRAKEIIESLAMIQVNYYGIPVYIEKINTEENTATVFPLDEMHNSQAVDLHGLSEVFGRTQ